MNRRAVRLALFLPLAPAFVAAQTPLLDQAPTARIMRVRSFASDVALDAHGNAIVDGKYLLNTGDVSDFLTRILPSGEVDLRFSVNAHNNFTADEVAPGVLAEAIQPDGKIVAAIGAPTTDGTATASEIIRLNPDGSRDPSFSTRGLFGAGNLVFALHPEADGRLLAAGRVLGAPNNTSAAVLRLTASGAVDPSFHAAERPRDVEGLATYTLEPVGRGRYLLGKGPWRSLTIAEGNHDTRLTAVDARGIERAASAPGTESALKTGVYAVLRESSGRVVVGGINILLRLLPDGRIDPYFKTPALRATAPIRPWVVRTLRLQKDGKIVIGGDFVTPAGSAGVARILADGQLDAAFERKLGAGFRAADRYQTGVTGLAIQSDGKIICVGSFDTVNGNAQRALARLNADGSVDAYPALADVGLR